MAKSVEIPQDIIDSIIAEVGYDTRLLKQCSLVSSSFLHPSRKQLFSRITLGSDETCQGIYQLLVQNPVILSFIRIITLTEDGSGFDNPEWMNLNGTSLLAILRLPFCYLECFLISVSLDYWNPISWNWNSFSSELKDALSNIIHSSNLKTLSLEGITKVPITFFLHIVHLTTLELYFLSLNDLGGEKLSPLTLAVSKGVSPIASHTVPVIDRLVWHLNVEHHSRYYGDTETIFLPFMCRLRFFKMNIELATMHDLDVLSLLMGSLCTSLISPATLEHLEINIFFLGDDYIFRVNRDHSDFYGDLRDADVWTRLDSITSNPTGSRLKQVYINIRYSIRAYNGIPVEDKFLEAVLDGLPLLRAKGILFVKVNLEWILR